MSRVRYMMYRIQYSPTIRGNRLLHKILCNICPLHTASGRATGFSCRTADGYLVASRAAFTLCKAPADVAVQLAGAGAMHGGIHSLRHPTFHATGQPLPGLKRFVSALGPHSAGLFFLFVPSRDLPWYST